LRKSLFPAVPHTPFPNGSVHAPDPETVPHQLIFFHLIKAHPKKWNVLFSAAQILAKLAVNIVRHQKNPSLRISD
jgi:hypothetical protein